MVSEWHQKDTGQRNISAAKKYNKKKFKPRKCLKCDKKFKPKGKDNWICSVCKKSGAFNSELEEFDVYI